VAASAAGASATGSSTTLGAFFAFLIEIFFFAFLGASTGAASAAAC